MTNGGRQGRGAIAAREREATFFGGTGFTRVTRRLPSARFMPYTPRLGALIAQDNCHTHLIMLSTSVGQHVLRPLKFKSTITRGEIVGADAIRGNSDANLGAFSRLKRKTVSMRLPARDGPPGGVAYRQII